MQNNLCNQPKLVLQEIARGLPISDVNNLCLQGKECQRKVCDDDLFWRNRLIQEKREFDDEDENYKRQYVKDTYILSIVGKIGLDLFGIKQEINRFVPVLKGIIQISCVSDGMMMVTFDGELYAVGKNKFGRFGTRDDSSELYKKEIFIADRIKEAKLSNNHSIVLTQKNEVKTSGRNSYGTLGEKFSTYEDYRDFYGSALTTHGKKIGCNSYISWYIDDRDDLYMFGQIPNIGASYTPTLVYNNVENVNCSDNDVIYILDKNSNVLSFSSEVFEDDRIKIFLSKIRYISDEGLIFITNDNKIISYNSSMRQISIFENLPFVVKSGEGNRSMMLSVIDSNNTLYYLTDSPNEEIRGGPFDKNLITPIPYTTEKINSERRLTNTSSITVKRVTGKPIVKTLSLIRVEDDVKQVCLTYLYTAIISRKIL